MQKGSSIMIKISHSPFFHSQNLQNRQIIIFDRKHNSKNLIKKKNTYKIHRFH